MLLNITKKKRFILRNKKNLYVLTFINEDSLSDNDKIIKKKIIFLSIAI